MNVEKDFQLQFQNTFEHTMQEFVLSVNEPSKPRVKDQNWKTDCIMQKIDLINCMSNQKSS